MSEIEAVDEIIIHEPHSDLECDILIVGGGVGSGYFLDEFNEIKNTLKNSGFDMENELHLKILVISSEQVNLYPYERPALSKVCMNPSDDSVRNFLLKNDENFPFCCKNINRSHNRKWYQDNNFNFLFGYLATRCDLNNDWILCEPIRDDAEFVGKSFEDFLNNETIQMNKNESNESLNDFFNYQNNSNFHKTFKIKYNKLIISTGVRPKTMRDLGDLNQTSIEWHRNQIIKNQTDLFFSKHEIDYISGVNLHGSKRVHTLRDLGDCCRLVQGIRNRIFDDIDDCFDPIIIIGGGFLSIEIASILLKNITNEKQIILLTKHDHILKGLLNEELALYYEKKLKEKGLIIGHNVILKRLWHDDETGEFNSIKIWDGKAERGGVVSYYNQGSGGIKGVICDHHQSLNMTDNNNNDLNDSDSIELYIPAAFVFLAIGSIANSEIFEPFIETLHDKSIPVNDYFQTSHESDNIYAIGDVSTMNNEYFDDYKRFEHVGYARHSARMVCRHILQSYLPTLIEFEPFPFYSYRYTKFLNYSPKLFGENIGKCIIKGLDEYELGDSNCFVGFWVNGESLYNHDDIDVSYSPLHVIGVFVEGGDENIWRLCKEIVELRPEIKNLERIQTINWLEYLNDPFSIAPEPADFGYFPMEDNVDIIKQKFGNNPRNFEDIIKLMEELGADWTVEENQEACLAMDNGNGYVTLETFLEWWLN